VLRTDLDGSATVLLGPDGLSVAVERAGAADRSGCSAGAG
jgi:hypothetical protein